MIVRLGRYAAIYLATIAGLVVIGLVMTSVLDMSPPSIVSVLLPPVVGAILEGQRLSRSDLKSISTADAWRAAAAMTGVALVIDLAVFAVALSQPSVRDIVAAYSTALYIITAAALILLLMLVNRYGLTYAFNNERKRKGGA